MTNPENDQKRASLEAVLDNINKRYGSGAIWQLGEDDIPDVQSVSTNAITLDQALGIGGVPRGRITEIYGPESSGKTTVALHVIANVQRAGGTAAIIDAEHALDLSYAEKLGVDVPSLLVSQPDTGEQALEITEALVRAGVDIVVVDSVAMLIPEAELKGEMGDLQVGAQARLMAKALRKLTGPVSDANAILLMINQIRANIGSFRGPSETTPGGKALRFAASVRVDLRRIESLRSGDQNIGIRVLAKVVKNKLAPPSSQAEFSVYFNRGIDRIASLVDAAEIKGVITKSGSWYKYDGQNVGQGKERVAAKLANEPEFLALIERALAA